MLLGQQTKHRLNRGGDRQLNHALHIIAITRAQHDPATRQYLARKQAEGKTTKGAPRCLKRHLARRFHRLLSLPANNPHHDHESVGHAPPETPQLESAHIAGAAPTLMPCIR